MKVELKQKLFEDYPNFFEKLDEINCGDGWFDILYTLCRLLKQEENFIKLYKKENYEDFKFDQIKEKFSNLTIYSSGGNETIKGAIKMAETVSSFICEDCGNHGKPVRVGGLLRTLCDICDLKAVKIS